MKKIIVVTGLGDNGIATELATRGWREEGYEPIVFVPEWEKEENIEKKIERLEKLVDKEKPKVILGISAGASLALNVFVQNKDKVGKMVSVCGRLRFGWSENVISRKLQENTLKTKAFYESVELVETYISKLSEADKKRVLTFSSELGDELIPIETSQLDGATNIMIPIGGHLLTITAVLTKNFEEIKKFVEDN